MATGFCSRTEKDKADTTIPPDGNGAGAISPIGQPSGEIRSRTVGAEGGELTDESGKIHIVIHAGALKTATPISIQRVTNNCPGALGEAFRLLPHGQIFDKPVTVRFRYSDDDVNGTFEKALGIAYQDEKHIWRSVKSSERDTARNKIAVQTTHFSDWTTFAALQLDPMVEAISPGATLALLVHYHFTPTDDDDLLAPLTENTEAVLQNATSLLDPKFIEKWEKQGEGTLKVQSNKAKYTAPGTIPKRNPVEIVVRIRNGNSIDLLISKIFVVPPGVSVPVNDGAWLTIPGRGYNRYGGTNLIAADNGGRNVKIFYEGQPYGIYNWTMETVGCTYNTDAYQTYYHIYGLDPRPSKGKLHVTYQKTGSGANDQLIPGTFDIQQSGFLDNTTGVPSFTTQRLKGVFRVQSLHQKITSHSIFYQSISMKNKVKMKPVLWAIACLCTMSSCEKKVVDPIKNEIPQPIVIDKIITTRTVLENRIEDPNLPDYIVSKSIDVEAELTLKPGVVIAFARDAVFNVTDDGGVLIAKGTAEKKIRLIGLQPTKGFWAGIMLLSPSTANAFEYVEFAHAGSQTMLEKTKMAVAMFRESQASFKYCLFNQNDGYGLFVQEDATIPGFEKNAFRSNSESGIRLPAESVVLLDAQSSFTGENGRNVVEIIGDYLGSPDNRETVTWKGFEAKSAYRITKGLTARTGWVIALGVTIEMGADAYIIVNKEAHLIANGTKESPVKFRSANGQPAYWKGIPLHSTNRKNLLSYTEIMNGGSTSIIANKRANLALYGADAYMNITRSKVSASGGYGIWIGYESVVNDNFGETTVFSGNRAGDVKFENVN